MLAPVLYLIPLPAAVVDALPGRDLYAAGLALRAPAGTAAQTATATAFSDAAAAGPAFKPLSINPQLTLAAGLALPVPLAVFIGGRTQGARGLLTLVQVLLAVCQAVLGLVQYGSARHGDMLFAVAGSHADSAVGTYANRNHLAGLLAMSLPRALALLFYNLGRERPAAEQGRWRRRTGFLSSTRGSAALVYGAVALILLVGVVFTRSRMGITMAMLGVVLSTLLFAGRIGGRNTFGITGSVIAVAVGLGVAIGLAPVLERFSVQGVVEDGRGPLFGAALLRIGETFPVGTGPGTFSSAFPPVQPVQPVQLVQPVAFGMHYYFRHELFFLNLSNTLARRGPRLIKRSFDIGVASLLLTLLLPLFAYLAVQIRKDGGPVFFAHRRVGQHGRPFACLKFRTMVPDANQVLQHPLDTSPATRREWEQDHKLKHDPRITPVGAFLRRTSPDELPQLWTVLNGEMSLVAPPAHRRRRARARRRRHRVPPGDQARHERAAADQRAQRHGVWRACVSGRLVCQELDAVDGYCDFVQYRRRRGRENCTSFFLQPADV